MSIELATYITPKSMEVIASLMWAREEKITIVEAR